MGLAKIAKYGSPRRHAEISPVKVKDTHLMNNNLWQSYVCVESGYSRWILHV